MSIDSLLSMLIGSSSDELYVLASQVRQVYYVECPLDNECHVIVICITCGENIWMMRTK